MTEQIITNRPPSFRFYTQVHLPELTGIKAKNVMELFVNIQRVPGSVIYHHTHHFLQQHQYLSPEPPNDFAYWVSTALNEVELGEQLASINTCDFQTIRALREKIASTLEHFLQRSDGKLLKEARAGHEFHFIKSVSFILPTQYEVDSLTDFLSVLEKISIQSIYFHMFEARLRLEKGVNDFSNWLESALNEKELARKIAKLDPYTYTMERLRDRIARLIEARLAQKSATKEKES